MGDTENKQCDIYAKYRVRRAGFFGTNINGYEGIPQNLVLNLIGWMLLILLFSFLRKKAWNYGRLALVVQRTEQFAESLSNFTNMLFGGRSSNTSQQNTLQHPQRADGDLEAAEGGYGVVTTHLLKDQNGDSPPDGQEVHPQVVLRTRRPSIIPVSRMRADSDPDFNRVTQSGSGALLDTGYFSWIKIVFTLTDQQYLEKCGFDCVQYLSFQRHLIFLASIITLMSVVIVLPINYQGTPDSDTVAQFNQTTIINLKNHPQLLWVHVILAITFLFLSIAVMRHFSRALKFVEDDHMARRSAMIVGISRKYCKEDKVRKHFQEIYPDVEISEITFAYDISDLQSAEFSRQTAQLAVLYWEDYMIVHGRRPTMTPYYCGAICWSCTTCCGCGCDTRDAIEFYSQEEAQYTREVAAERERALTKPVGIAFVTFKTMDMAERVVQDYRFICKILGQTPQSKYGRKLKSKRWTVKFAPLPEDMFWEHLSTGLKSWYLKIFLVNLFLVIIVTLYTTPVIFLQNIDGIFNNILNTTTKNLEKSPPTSLSGLFRDTIPTLLLWLIAVTLPSLVSVSDKIVGFWTKTGENRSKMIKIFSFLIFMIVVLPSLGVTSVIQILQKTLSDDIINTASALNWECVFSKDNGALLVNYICTSTFLGTASELMRLPELFVYCVKLCFARSAAEIAAIRQSVLWDFQIGSQYAWMMLNFSIFSVFSVIFPIVTPFGLVYLIMKHCVDRYNIYFAYGPTKVEKEVHGTAINFVIVCMFILQINLLAYVTTQQGNAAESRNGVKGLKVFCVVAFCITAALFISQIFFNMCANFSPILYSRMSHEGLSVDNARNGDIASTSSEQAVTKTLDVPGDGKQGPSRRSAEIGHRRIPSTAASEDGFALKRKYFPKILQPPKHRHHQYHITQETSPRDSTRDSGGGGQGAPDSHQMNGFGAKITTTAMVNEEAKPQKVTEVSNQKQTQPKNSTV